MAKSFHNSLAGPTFPHSTRPELPLSQDLVAGYAEFFETEVQRHWCESLAFKVMQCWKSSCLKSVAAGPIMSCQGCRSSNVFLCKPEFCRPQRLSFQDVGAMMELLREREGFGA